MDFRILLAFLAAVVVSPASSAVAGGTDPGKQAPEAEASDLDAQIPGDGRPSRGTPEDRALWAAMRDDQNQMSIERALALKLYYRLRNESEDAQLAALAKERPGLSTQIEALRRRLYAARTASFDVLSRKWPVDPRLGCRSEMHDLGGAMEALPGQAGGSELGLARDRSLRCQARLRLVLQPLRKTSRDLLAVVEDVDKMLAAGSRAPDKQMSTPTTETAPGAAKPIMDPPQSPEPLTGAARP